MPRQLFFDTPEAFLQELRAQLASGVPRRCLQVHLPYHLHEVEELLIGRPSRLRYFALTGGLAGFGGGFLLALLTSIDWPVITGGKPIVSVPPFLLVGYLMTILIGSLSCFAGFLWLARLPSPEILLAGQPFESRFVLSIQDEDAT
ncbi:menaquinol oxidoreductase complex ACIII, DUF3341 subunit ActD [Syntrophotalea carbinolica DSM 2380]|uniref:Menaquinol oxidoreductase complex ACIII, DUF3341 subunit ActD n=1 Tax=Syntrophotalea carbinolica (strain DSM 2380 / NBRC 103641 / GraBd1) TaxID=338963 RepID=Q3A1G6_SYNC1|nr:quinol:electron acceptor oxidoreductase subunit ActD [Syntrophotalea carbinolica]ABA89791.1 menaquinol oxidoreductase complex ACIII, DUF3341 subunit ActD [Syntrophotalea carbinolica DSM 2380]